MLDHSPGARVPGVRGGGLVWQRTDRGGYRPALAFVDWSPASACAQEPNCGAVRDPRPWFPPARPLRAGPAEPRAVQPHRRCPAAGSCAEYLRNPELQEAKPADGLTPADSLGSAPALGGSRSQPSIPFSCITPPVRPRASFFRASGVILLGVGPLTWPNTGYSGDKVRPVTSPPFSASPEGGIPCRLVRRTITESDAA